MTRRRLSVWRNAIIALLIVALVATACSDPDTPDDEQADDRAGATEQVDNAGSTSAATGVTVQFDGPSEAPDTEITIDLADGSPDTGDAGVRETTVDGTALSSADTALLLSRLPDLEEEADDRADFARPPQTRPRPLPGEVLEQSFPPPGDGSGSVDSAEAGPLEVLRFQPEGPVDLAPFVSVTFNQPMIALGTVDQVEQGEIPVSVSPEMPGRWIWIGARTLRFEYEPGAIDRIPASTNYQVTVPAGIESINGGVLAEEVSFTFSTPTAQVVDVTPMNQSLSTEPLFFIEFDQRVDPDATLAVTQLTADRKPVDLVLAADTEIAEDPVVSSLAERALVDRFVVVKPAEALPTDAFLQLSVGPNIESLEGPETSDETFSFEGRTYGPLRIVDVNCGFGQGCQPGQEFWIEMSNRLDPEAFSADQVVIEPELPGARIGVSHSSITIQGATKGQTTYTITLKSDLTDSFGQQLGEDVSRTIDVGDADPALFRPGRSLVTLDPIVGDDRLNVTSINNDRLVVTVYAVDPAEDWAQFTEQNWQLANSDWQPDWAKLDERTVDAGGTRNEFTEIAIDLGDDLDEADGHVVVVVAPEQRRDDEWRNEPFTVWVQNTTLGVDAISDNAKALAWVTDLTTGEAVSDANVSLLPGSSGTTNSEGIAELVLGRDSIGLLAEVGDRRALIGDFWASAWRQNDMTRWYVVDDRGIYRPGETANIKGWVRSANAQTPAELTIPADRTEIVWTARDNFGNELASGEVDLNALGGFDLAVELPKDITLGAGGIEFMTRSDGQDSFYFHQLRVQEFRRPDFEVTVDATSPEPRFVDEVIAVHANADYFASGPLAGSQVEWLVNARPTSYSPPNWPDYDFGIWVPWWFGGFGGFGEDGFGFGGGGFSPGVAKAFSATTDGSGGHDLDITVRTEGKARPVMVDAAATVFDVNRQGINGSTSTLVHPAEVYVGLRGDRAFVKSGETISIDVIATDLDGALIADQQVALTSTRLEWRFEGGQWQEIPVPTEACDVDTSADGPSLCEFTPDQGGRYRITATTVDAAGRSALTELTRWVAGGTRPQNRSVTLEQVTIIPNGESWQPGDEAELLVQSPFADAHGLAVISRAGIDRTESFEFDQDGTAVLQIPILDDDVPAIGVQIEVVGIAPRSSNGQTSDVQRPAFASGQITLPVPADARRLNVDVAPRLARLEPGQDTSVDVRVTDAAGEPVEGAELLVVVVDEAVLSLTGYELTDPLDRFYPNNGFSTQVQRGRSSIRLSDPFSLESGGDGTAAATDAAGGGAGFDDAVEEEAMEDDGESAADFAASPAPAAEMRSTSEASLAFADEAAPKAIDLRTNFDALAVFEPEVRTDADGSAVIDVPLPDNLTRYRVMVAAVADATEGGSGDSNITARLPITVRPTPPRFANFGDVFEFPIVVQNATDEDRDVEVALRTTNLVLTDVDRGGITVTVPANDRVEVRFDVAADEAGTARWQVAASSGDFADAAEGELPVYTPATAEAFATYGVVDGNGVGGDVIAQPLTEPDEVFPQFGGLEISTSSTAVSALTDAVLYLAEYRYDNSDAFASRIIAVVALDDILESFEADGLPSPDELRAIINGDLDRLASMQNNDGGFPSWRRGRESIPYNSVQATHAMVLAHDEGLPVSEESLQNALWYLTNIRDHMPSWYGPRTRTAIEAYAVHVRFLAGDRDVDSATRVFGQRTDDQLDVAAWLWPVLEGTATDDEIELLLANRVTETPNAATFATDYGEQAWVILHSDRRTDAIVLDALLRQRPESDLIDKTLNGILASRGRRGRWTNVQENSFVLLAASSFFDEREAEDPDFVARVWLGDTYAVEQPYEGRTTIQTATLVPMQTLIDEGDTDIVVARDGDEGRLYYRLGLRYAPDELVLEPRDQGFVVQRTYEAVDDPTDVSLDDGIWTVKAGARVRVRLTMIADSRRTHVALIDPMPAGFESINPALATSEPIPPDEAPGADARNRFWWYRWFDHQNLRDDRAEAFATWLGAGSYEYTYVARATTPGEFVVPPTRAEQIYEPEVFGRSASTKVNVVD